MSGVDVLAVMAESIEDCKWLRSNSTKTMEVSPDELIEARAAVAELIEASKAIEAHNAAATMGEWERFSDALARVTGDAA